LALSELHDSEVAMRAALRWLLTASVVLIPVVATTGCAATPEPESAFTQVGPLSYEFRIVWESTSEALQQEGFPVELQERPATDEGYMASQVRTDGSDKMRSVELGRRASARVERLGPKKFLLRLAASRFERALPPPGVSPGDWHYVGRDEELLARLRGRVDKNIERRYRPAEGG
jgi:hypothetical protein